MCNIVLLFFHFFIVYIFELYKLYMCIQPSRKKRKKESAILSCELKENNSYDRLASIKNTHREKAPSNKTPALTKSINIYIWVVTFG